MHRLLIGSRAQRCVAQAQYHSKKGVFGFHPSCSRKTKLGASSQLPSYTEEELGNRLASPGLVQLVEAYHRHGHKKASLDPLGLQEKSLVPELDLSLYGIREDQLSHAVATRGVFNCEEESLSLCDVIDRLESTYCGTMAAEFHHLPTLEERLWFARAFEERNKQELSPERKVRLAKLLLKSQAFDNFVGSKFPSVKRYGGEGGESMLGFFEEVFAQSAQDGVENIVMAIAHRGRLNLMTCLLEYPPVIMFKKMKGESELPEGAKGLGDVLSHLYTSVDLDFEGKSVHVSMLPNPSHLEASAPVAMGKARAKLQAGGHGPYSSDGSSGNKALCLQVHGDASFVGQGVSSESFCIADVPHFEVGGSIHIIINNQLGFTTESERGRSSSYSSDLAKVNGYPVIHVNADYPEDVVKAASIAVNYRQKFGRDVIVDLVCFRKWGHNEIDDPSFTQPIMYDVIKNRQSIPDLYASNVKSEGVASQEDLDGDLQQFVGKLNEYRDMADTHKIEPYHLLDKWKSLVQAGEATTTWDTGVDVDTLKYVGAKSVTAPEDLKVHPTIKKTHLDRQLQRIEEGTTINWACAEALAMGSLLHQGFNVRISGQDVGRGTFSHRHCMLVDQMSDDIHIPLNHMHDQQTGFLEVANSALTEEAVIGFEYGLSLDSPKNLVIWEAQFGDFFNAAQSMIDTFVSGGELKWLLQSSMVMLLPHGMDGAGPEHSSCRIERFLQMCDSKEDKVDGDNVNMQIVNPTTPAQYFHLLRRQMIRNFRKPLIVAAPKVILRLPAAVSSLVNMAPGTHFQPVLPDPSIKTSDVSKVKKVIVCSGKHYYNLVEERGKRGLADSTAIVRLESLCPFPVADIQKTLELYSKAEEFVWSQEEHRNMGAWSFVNPRFSSLVGQQLQYAGRDVSGIPAVGIGKIHKQECVDIMEMAFK